MKEFAQQGKIFLAYGPKASVGNFYLPPLYYQVQYWLAVLFGHPPLLMQWVVSIVESFTPVVLFFWLKTLVKPRTAFWAALGYALFALPTSFGTFAWNPNMIPFFSTLAALCWFRLIERRETWTIFVGCLATTVAIHLHYQSVVLIPFAALIFMYDIWRRPIRVWQWLMAGALCLATFLPYFITEHLTNWPNTRQILLYFTQEHSRYFDRVSKINFVISFIPAFLEKVIWNVEFPYYVFGRVFLLLTGAVFAILAVTRPKWRWLALYFVCIVIMLRVYKGDKLEYYLSTLYVLPAFLMAASWHIGKKVIVLGMMVLAGWAGFSLFTNQTPDSIPNLNKAVTAIQQNTTVNNPFGLHFQDDDLVNIFSYKLAGNSEFKLQAGSPKLIEICDTIGPCAWNGVRECAESKGYTYSVLLKDKVGYIPQEQIVIGNQYVILVGELEHPQTSIGYDLYPDDSTFGSDVILPGIYQK